jgi:TRAP-type C4-dicarboxylate transport system substrate-binding protein
MGKKHNSGAKPGIGKAKQSPPSQEELMRLKSLAVGCATALAATFSLTTLAQAADTVVLKVAHFLPSMAPAQTQVIGPWCDKLNAESGGRITCQIYPSMQLGGTPSKLVDQVRNGIADVVWTAPGYSAGRFPAIEALELPFMVGNALDGSRMSWEYYNTYAQDEFSAYKVLAVHIDGGAVFHTAKTDINALADVAGLKLRTPTRLAAKGLQAMGGVPVSMPPSQVTEAISKGVVDGGILPWELMRPTKIDEVTKYHVSPPEGRPLMIATVLTLLMNKQKYDSLPDDLKQIIDANSGLPLVEKFGTVWDDVTAANKAYAAKLPGAVAHDLTDQAYNDMRKATAAIDPEWVDDVTDRGLDGKALLAGARALSVKYFPQQQTAVAQ